MGFDDASRPGLCGAHSGEAIMSLAGGPLRFCSEAAQHGGGGLQGLVPAHLRNPQASLLPSLRVFITWQTTIASALLLLGPNKPGAALPLVRACALRAFDRRSVNIRPAANAEPAGANQRTCPTPLSTRIHRHNLMGSALLSINDMFT